MRILFLPNWRVFRTRADRQRADYYEPGSPYWFFEHFADRPEVAVLDAARWAGWRLEERYLHFYLVQGIVAIFAARRADVVLVHGAQSAVVLLAAKRICPKALPPIVVVDVGTLNGGRPERWDFAVARWAFSACSAIIWHARVSSKIVAEHAPELVKRGVFVPFGIDEREYPVAESYDGDYAVCVGYARRDWSTLFSAWESLDGLPLLLVGAPSRVAERLPVGVRVVPPVSFSEYIRLVREARLVVLPVEDGRASWGQMTLLQTMIMGRPVVVTDAAPVRDYTRRGVEAVPPGDAPALAAAVRATWQDREMRARLGREARDAVLTGYRERDMARCIEEVLRDASTCRTSQ